MPLAIDSQYVAQAPCVMAWDVANGYLFAAIPRQLFSDQPPGVRLTRVPLNRLPIFVDFDSAGKSGLDIKSVTSVFAEMLAWSEASQGRQPLNDILSKGWFSRPSPADAQPGPAPLPCFDLRAIDSDTMQEFILSDQAITTGTYARRKWSTGSSISTGGHGPFKVCESGGRLFLVFSGGGIYEVAMPASPESKMAKATKISDEAVTTVVVDKDAGRTWCAAKGRVFEVSAPDKTVLLPPVASTGDAHRDLMSRMLAILQAGRTLAQPATSP
jgi:hypothetical protein